MKITTIKNETPTHYLLNLNLRNDEQKIVIPYIGKDELDRVTKADTRMVIANAWHRPLGYNYGAFTVNSDGAFVSLAHCKDAKLLNADTYIFESGSDDHKGLVAIELLKKNVPFFVMLSDGNHHELFFEKEADDAYVELVTSNIPFADDETEIIVSRDQWLTLYGDDYEKMVKANKGHIDIVKGWGDAPRKETA